MNMLSKLPALLLLLLFTSEAMAAADNEMLTLLKELKSEIKALKSQAEQANARITDLEKQLDQSRNQQQTAAKQPVADGKPASVTQASAAAGSQASTQAKEDKAGDKPAVTVGDIKGTLKIPGTDTSIGLGGFVKMDALFANTSAGQDKLGDQQSVYSQIPVGNMPGEHSQTTFVAKDSRLWFKSFTPSSWGDINTYVEFDFYGAPATYTYTPRLRHAYGSLGNFLAGQTWTTFTNTASIPDHLDAGVSAGAIANLRQPLIRWTQPFKWGDTSLELQAALESPRSLLWLPTVPAGNATSTDPNTDSYLTAPNADRYPDLVARLNYNPDWGSVSLAALGRNLRYTNNTTSLQKEIWGGGVNLAGKINTVGLDNVRFMAHLGKGIGRYITTSNTFEDAAISSTGNLQLVTTYGGLLSYQHWWNKQWRSSLTYGFSHADQPTFVNSVLNQQVQSIHANLLWSPISQTVMGVEYVYATRELLDGRSGDLQRVQFSARYNF